MSDSGSEDYECGSCKPTPCARWSLFIVFLVFGIVLVVTSIFKAFGGTGSAVAMVIIGNIMIICSLIFLKGPRKFFESLKAPDRLIVSVCYLLSLVGYIIFVIIDKLDFLKFLFLALLIVSGCYYIISYFPKVRACLCKCCNKNGADSTPLSA